MQHKNQVIRAMAFNRKPNIVLWLCLLAGFMDGSSGLLLMLLPKAALRLMGVLPIADEALVFIRFIGAFVFSVGMLYLIAWIDHAISGRWRSVPAVLLTTAWIRSVVCIFTSLAIALSALSVEWMSVPLVDGVLAGIQAWIVLNKWVPEDES